MLRFACLTGGLAVLLAGCGDDNVRVPRPAISETLRRPGHVEKIVHASVNMTVEGDRDLTLKNREVKLRMVIIEGDRNPQIVHFFSVSTAEPVKLDDTTFLQFDADLAPGIYNGPGRYDLSTERPTVEGTQTNLSSASYIQFLDLEPKPTGPKFSVLTEPCTLTVKGAPGTEGSVDCPKLSTEDGRSVAARWDWTLL